MFDDKLPPIHPGEMLREEFLKPLGITPTALAKKLHVPRTRICRLVHEDMGLTADTALRLARFFGTSAEMWLNMQAAFDLKELKLRMVQGGTDIDSIKPLAAAA